MKYNWKKKIWKVIFGRLSLDESQADFTDFGTDFIYLDIIIKIFENYNISSSRKYNGNILIFIYFDTTVTE